MTEKYIRKPNTECFICKKAIYRRPSQKATTTHSYCSGKCQKEHIGAKIYKCDLCGLEFKQGSKRPRKFCSRSCSNQGRAGIKYKVEDKLNLSQRTLLTLKEIFDFKECMVQGCTYDIHRLISGKNGGKYIIGNMFAICPNHHAEIHRNICHFNKLDDCTLVAIYNTEDHTALASRLVLKTSV